MVLQSCCCGCSLRTGSLIIGYIYVILNAIGAGYGIIALLVMKFGDSIQEDVMRGRLLAIGIVCLQTLVINILLVVGVHTGRRVLVHLWLIVGGAGMVIQWSGAVMYATLASSVYGGVGAPLGVVFAAMCSFALQIYILLVILSHYEDMKKQQVCYHEAIPTREFTPKMNIRHP